MGAIDANVPFLTQLYAFFNLFKVTILRAFEHLIAEKYYGFFESPTAYSVSRCFAVFQTYRVRNKNSSFVLH